MSQTVDNYTKKADNLIKTSANCIRIPKDGAELASEFVRVECKMDQALSSKLAVDFMATPLKPSVYSDRTKEVHKYWSDRSKEVKKGVEQVLPPNVLIIGIDSISRLNMIRNLPLTRKYLTSNDFVELKGYTKIGENTFPNVMGFLCGYETLGWNHPYPCWKGGNQNFDQCPFIWKRFAEGDYVTALLEDSPEFSIFNYRKTGFVLPPVDYYLRPFSVAYRSNELRKFRGCVSGGTETDMMLKYIRDFQTSMASEVPYFLLSWFTSVGHDDMNNLKNYDLKFKKLIREAVESKEVNAENTIILFISDHGYRYGGFRETFLGYYEESLPFFFVRVPPTVRGKFPDWQRHLVENSRKLLSPLDLHATFEHIVNGSASVDAPKKYFSFFEQGPSNRTCESAGIPNMYCRCGVSPSASVKSKSMKGVASFVVSAVNEILRESVDRGLCAPLKYKKPVYFRSIAGSEAKAFTEYLIAIETEPVGARFEARVKVFAGNGTMEVVGDVSRINSYKGQDACMDDYRLKNFCACSDYVRHKSKS